MLLARGGLRVLVVDPARYGSDTLSTHAVMRGGILQLHRWGVLDDIRSEGTPAIHATTFHYGRETIEVPIKERNGVDALFAPRRTVIDRILVDHARSAGAEIVHGYSVVGLLRDHQDRVSGVVVSGADREPIEISCDLTIGADGTRSRVARLVEAGLDYETAHSACSIYGYSRHLSLSGYHWFYELGASIGTIPTNDDEACVFALIPRSRFDARGEGGLDGLFRETLSHVSSELAEDVMAKGGPEKLRAFAGLPGYLRRATGPGWALVGDAGYFRDPITAHGITDALREAEFLARAVVAPSGDGLASYQQGRDERVRGLLDVTDRLASFDWDIDEAKEEHLRLSREMNALVESQLAFD